jgi:tetratricopeptide (TPR) repeat protein
MNTSPLDSPSSGFQVTMHGDSGDESSFTQIGTQIVQQVPPPTVMVRHSLPPDTAAFTGRGAELERIASSAVAAVHGSGVFSIHAIGGMPGVGKTALAVHVAYLLKERFPDRQLFIDLHAHTPGREPVDPANALAGLLASSGLDTRNLPDSLDDRAALWRDQMAGKRALLILDNAFSSTQVAPLLPGGNCLALVTSRRYLGDLPGAAIPVSLDALPPDQALEMFMRIAPRASGSPEGVMEVVRLAGFLPLAVSLLARIYARHESWTLANLAAETKASLLTLAAENETVAAAFEMSYRYLDVNTRRFFRFLGAHPAIHADIYSAAILAGTTLIRAAEYLDILHREGLLVESGYRRYGMHDLIRLYARDLADSFPESRDQALIRLLDYYQYTSALADTRLTRQRRSLPVTLAELPEGAVPSLPDYSQALEWVRTERDSLLACLDHVTEIGDHSRIVSLSAGIAALLRHDGPWADAITRHARAAESALYLGNFIARADALNDLGVARQLSGDYRGAKEVLDQALEIFRERGVRLGLANVLANLGLIPRMAGDYPRAKVILEQALHIYQDLGDRLGQAGTLAELGSVRWLSGDFKGAASILERALDVYRDLDDRVGQGDVLIYLGCALRLVGDYLDAENKFKDAWRVYQDLGDRLGQGDALLYLGTVWRITENHGDASDVLIKSLEIYRDLGNRVGQANALMYLGATWRLTGQHEKASEALQECLDIYRDIEDRGGENQALNEVGALRLACGDREQAEYCHCQALEMAREISSPWDEAHALVGLGRCALASGRIADARGKMDEGLKIFQRIGAAEAIDLVVEIGNIGATAR